MTSHVLASPRLARRAFGDTLLVIVVWAVIAAVLAVKFVPGLIAHGVTDPDAQMRLVEVRDYLAGAAWTDLVQPRLDPPHGVLMHWSRLVDWPLAALIRLCTPLLGHDGAEIAAVTIWPLALFLVFIGGVVSAARKLGGEGAFLPALALAVCAGPAVGTFVPGHITHHNVQLTLFAVLMALIVRIERGEVIGVIAGIVSAISLSVGLETLALVGIAGAGLALMWALDPARMRGGVNGFGLFFAGGMVVQRAFAAAPADWLASPCDIASAPYVALALIGGFGLAGLVWLDPKTLPLRLAGLAVLGIAAIGIAGAINPTCLKGPYAQIDPRIIPLWLDHVEEAGSFDAIVRSRPAQAFGLYFAPFLALVPTTLAFTLVGRTRRAAWGLVLALLATAIAVSLWQARGSTFAAALAVPGLALAISEARRRAEGRNPLVLAATLLIAYSVPNQTIEAIAASLVERAMTAPDTTKNALPGTTPIAGGDDSGYARCAAHATFAGLAVQTPGLVLSESNLGPSILLNTRHSVLGAPYHRNTNGLIDGLTALEAKLGDAYQIIARRHVAYVALCAEDPEIAIIRHVAPDGLAVRLLNGDTPDWLKPLDVSGPLKIWRVVDPSLASLPDQVMTGAAVPRGHIAPGAASLTPGLRGTLTPQAMP